MFFEAETFLFDEFDWCAAENRLEPIPASEKAHAKETDCVEYAEKCHEFAVLFENVMVLEWAYSDQHVPETNSQVKNEK